MVAGSRRNGVSRSCTSCIVTTTRPRDRETSQHHVSRLRLPPDRSRPRLRRVGSVRAVADAPAVPPGVVVDDIVRRLAPFGNIEIGPLGILRLPSIAHLATSIRFEEYGGADKMSFADMVRRLHPTAALGVWPRTEAGERWLREADRGVRRRTFGAPFGLEREDHRGLAVVAIRNVQWLGDAMRIGSGAGLLAESRLEREFDELREKREQVNALLGLGARVAVEA